MLIALLLLAQGAGALNEQASAAMREHRYIEAAALYERLVSSNPKDAVLHMNLGVALYSAQKYADAVPQFERFLKAKSNPGPVHLLLGASLMKLGRACEAAKALKRARLWQETQQVLIELANASYTCGDYKESLKTVEFALTGLPQHLQLLRLRARLFWRTGNFGRALPAYAVLAEHFTDDAEFQHERGDTLLQLNQPMAAMPYLRQALRLDPNLLAARGSLGEALLSAGEADQAIPHLIASSAADLKLLAVLSRAYRASGRVEEADRVAAEYASKSKSPK